MILQKNCIAINTYLLTLESGSGSKNRFHQRKKKKFKYTDLNWDECLTQQKKAKKYLQNQLLISGKVCILPLF